MAIVESILMKTAGARLFVKEHEAAIEIGGGIACFALSVALAARAGIKTKEEVTMAKENIESMNDALAEGEITQDDHKKQIRKIKMHSAGRIALAWAPSVLGFAGGTGLILRSHHVMVKSNVALAAALKTSEEALAKYREKNKEEIGEEKEQKIYDGQTVEKKGKKTYVTQGTPLSPYARLMSRDTLSRSSDWCNSSNDYNIKRVKTVEQLLNRQLRINGYVTRRDAYDALGFDVSNEDPDCLVDGWRLVKYGGKTEEEGIRIRIIDHIGGDPNDVKYVKDPWDDSIVRAADAFWIDLNCEGCILATSTKIKIKGDR